MFSTPTPLFVPANYSMAKKEWEFAKKKFKSKNTLQKISRKNKLFEQHIKHSFLSFRSPDNQEIQVKLIPHHYLGKGGFGKVKLVSDEKNNKYALKISECSFNTDDANENEREILTELKRFKAQATIARFDKKYPWLSLRPKHYLLEDHIEGITVYDYLKLCALNDNQKKLLAYHITKAVNDLHAKKIIHVDLKPNNMLIHINEKGLPTITLIDFGLSKLLEDKQNEWQGKTQSGAHSYSAPEAEKDQEIKILSAKSDIFSLGRMFTKDLQLQGSIIETMCEKEPYNRPSLSKVLEELQSQSSDLQLPPADLIHRLEKKYERHLEKLYGGLTNPSETSSAHEKITEGKQETTSNNLTAFSLEALSRIFPLSKKNELVEHIHKMLAFTDNIKELHRFFSYLKTNELNSKTALLRKKNGVFGKIYVANTSKWQKVIGHIQTRALEIAVEKQYENEPIDHDKTLYDEILQFDASRWLHTENEPAKKFRQLCRM